MAMPVPSPDPNALPWGGFQALCWSLAAILLSAVAGYALAMSWIRNKKNTTTDDFIAVPKSVPTWRIGWSLFAGTMGAWVVSSSAYYAASAGLVGLITHSLATGLPNLMIAVMGPLVERSLPHAFSLSEFSGWRFGLVAQIGVTLMTVLSMSIFMLCEFVTIGGLFQFYVGPVGYPIVIAVGVLTLAYTTFGGLYVSIATDQVQGIAATVLMVVVAIYLGATFDQPLPPMSALVAGNTYVGLSSILTMPASMCAATVFNEAMWQRAFAAKTDRKLLWGGVIAAVAMTFMALISGLCGWLFAWADPNTVLAANINLYMFYGLSESINYTTGTVNNGIGVVVLMMAVVMNEGVVDSLQNGLLLAFSSVVKLGIRYHQRWYPGRLPADYQMPLRYTRLMVVCINVPFIVLGSIGCGQGWSIMSLWLISSLVLSTGCVPLLAGLSRGLQPFYGGVSDVSVQNCADHQTIDIDSEVDLSTDLSDTTTASFELPSPQAIEFLAPTPSSVPTSPRWG